MSDDATTLPLITHRPARTPKRSRNGSGTAAEACCGERPEDRSCSSSGRRILHPTTTLLLLCGDHHNNNDTDLTIIRDESTKPLAPAAAASSHRDVPLMLLSADAPSRSTMRHRSYSTFCNDDADDDEAETAFSCNNHCEEGPQQQQHLLRRFSPYHFRCTNWNDETFWTRLRDGCKRLCYVCRRCVFSSSTTTTTTDGKNRRKSASSSSSSSSSSITTTASGCSTDNSSGNSNNSYQDHDDDDDNDDDEATNIIDAQTTIDEAVATTFTLTIRILLSIAIAIIAFRIGTPYYSYIEESKMTMMMMPEWKWDRNVYIPPTAIVAAHTENSPQQQEPAVVVVPLRFSLIAQLAADAAMERLADVSSRPNRAYARQWKMDYVRYAAGRRAYSATSCFDAAYVLRAVIGMDAERHQGEDGAGEQEPSPLSSSLSLSSPPPPAPWPQQHPLPSPQPQPQPREAVVRYGSVVLLPADAIVMDLDQNIVERTLPQEKLVAISGWVDGGRNLDASSGLIVFNLDHRYATTVANLWWDMLQGSVETCGATNGVSTLIQVIATVMDDATESLDDLIEPMKEHANGALGKQLSIKCLPSSVPGSRIEILTNSLHESTELLQQTADSVCYRFYPKCEVVS